MSPKEVREQLRAKGLAGRNGRINQQAADMEPWQFTRAEFREVSAQKATYGQSARKQAKLGYLFHRHYVALAIEKGKPVPPEVLEDYGSNPA